MTQSLKERLVVRLRGLAIAGPCLLVLVTAARLTPCGLGYGTHEQLGLPPCSMVANHRLPCPTCGMTTSVTYAVHGNIAQSFQAQPAGLALAAGMVFLAAVGIFELATGRGTIRMLRPGVWWALAGLGVLLAGWGAKLLLGYLGGTLPLR